jgi:hypothetical protein
MSTVILLIVAAMWAAVLLPPIFRSKIDRPQSSVDVFRRQLHTLQSGVPQRGAYGNPSPYGRSAAPMRAMARPFVPAPAARRASLGAAPVASATGGRSHHHTASQGMPRPVNGQVGFAPMSGREMLRRRRTNVLYGILSVNGVSLFLAFTTGSSLMTLIFGAAFLSLVGYCYMLVQIRQQHINRGYRHSYYRAA